MLNRIVQLAVLAAILLLSGGGVGAQITGNVDVLPNLSPAGLTDLNNVILFRSSNRGYQAFEAPLDPDDYIVGPGDNIEINVWTPMARSFLLTVTPEGSLLIPSYGELTVSGLSLADAKEMIVESLGSEYPTSEITATLTQARRVRVHVSGFVAVPGTYELSAGQRITDALAMAQGIKPAAGSARNVTSVTPYGTASHDLLAFYARGHGEGNSYLVGGDYIQVPPREPAENHMQIAGAVQVPGFVEYREGDRASDLIEFGYGFQPRADLGDITLTRTDPGTGRTETFHLTASTEGDQLQVENDMLLARRDRLFIGYQQTGERTATVALYGEVLRPGHYAVVEDSTTLSELLETAGGLTVRASPHETEFLRPSYRSLIAGDSIPPLVSMQLDRLLAGDSTFDVPLKHRDSVHIPSRSLAVQVLGRVRRPGIIPYTPGMTASQYIERAGGFAVLANKGQTRVIRAVSGAVEKPNDERPLAPGDQIFVPFKESTSFGSKLRDGLTFVSTLATTFFVIREIAR